MSATARIHWRGPRNAPGPAWACRRCSRDWLNFSSGPGDLLVYIVSAWHGQFSEPARVTGGALSAQPMQVDRRLRYLPLVTLYLTERCNSRCVTCDYWRHGRFDMDLGAVQRLLPSLAQRRTSVALISGG